MSIYANFQRLARKLIEKYTPDGSSAVLRRTGTLATNDPQKPWRQEQQEQINFVDNQEWIPVRVVFLPDDLEDRQLFKYLSNRSTLSGQVNAWLAVDLVDEVALNDVFYRPRTGNNASIETLNTPEAIEEANLNDGAAWETWSVSAVDTYRPARTPIVHFLELKN